MPDVLVTAFAPFGPHNSNPTMDIVEQLRLLSWPSQTRLHTRVLPVIREQCIAELRRAIHETNPKVVIALGLAANRARIGLERIAINIDDFPIADNAGNLAIDETIVKDGPLAYKSTLPIKAILQHWQEHNINGEISNTAGTYLCNHLFYGMQHCLKERPVNSGFIHTPPLAENGQSLDLNEQCSAIQLAIETSLGHTVDIALSAGRTD